MDEYTDVTEQCEVVYGHGAHGICAYLMHRDPDGARKKHTIAQLRTRLEPLLGRHGSPCTLWSDDKLDWYRTDARYEITRVRGTPRSAPAQFRVHRRRALPPKEVRLEVKHPKTGVRLGEKTISMQSAKELGLIEGE